MDHDVQDVISLLPSGQHQWVVTGYTDLRKSINGLMDIVDLEYDLSPYDDNIFLFCGRRCDRVKILYHQGNMLYLLYGRMDEGRYFWPRNGREIWELDINQAGNLLTGHKIKQEDAIRTIVSRIYSHQ